MDVILPVPGRHPEASLRSRRAFVISITFPEVWLKIFREWGGSLVVPLGACGAGEVDDIIGLILARIAGELCLSNNWWRCCHVGCGDHCRGGPGLDGRNKMNTL